MRKKARVARAEKNTCQWQHGSPFRLIYALVNLAGVYSCATVRVSPCKKHISTVESNNARMA